MMRGMLGGQTTLRSSATVSGIGVHSGSPVTLTLHPTEADTGIVFLRCGPDGQRDREIIADYRAVTATEFATVLGDKNGPAISTTEHALAALHALGIDNAVVEVDGPEVPIMDGSAEPFVAAIDQAGIAPLPAPRRCIKILKPVRVGKNGSYAELRPYGRGLRIEAEIDFDHPLIGAYRTVRGGHKLNHAMVNVLMADRSAWEYVDTPDAARRIRGHAEPAGGFTAPAYGPDVS